MVDYKFLLNIVYVLVVPMSVFWVLFRFGFVSILDALAIAVVLVVLVWVVLRFLFDQKVFSFRRQK